MYCSAIDLHVVDCSGPQRFVDVKFIVVLVTSQPVIFHFSISQFTIRNMLQERCFVISEIENAKDAYLLQQHCLKLYENKVLMNTLFTRSTHDTFIWQSNLLWRHFTAGDSEYALLTVRIVLIVLTTVKLYRATEFKMLIIVRAA